ncbi:MAG: queuosine precursor transporter [Parcubacteria group bacterium]|nr:queuosine precursor transporter [Parcubacteria group bacterium]
MHTSTEQKFSILFALFVGALISANLLGVKIITILGVSTSVGIFAYPLTFLINDAITEVYGKERSRHMVNAAIVAQAMVFVVLALSLVLPPAGRFTNNEAYTTIFSNSLRIIAASLTAFFLSQRTDIFSFTWLKGKTHGRFLWLRANLSTILSQLADTTLFMFIAFYQVTPKFDVAFLFSLIIPYWILKIAYSLLSTPIVYALVAWLKHPNNSGYTTAQ